MDIIISYSNILVFFFVLFLVFFFFFFELKTMEGWFFQRVHLCIWATAGHKLGTLSIRVHNSYWQFMTIHELWNLTIFPNFKTSLVIAPSPPHPPASLWRSAYENRYVTHPLPLYIYTASGGVHALLTLETTECSASTMQGA